MLTFLQQETQALVKGGIEQPISFDVFYFLKIIIILFLFLNSTGYAKTNSETCEDSHG